MSIPSRVTVVVVTYNRLALLKRCVAALLGQSLAPANILIVDNASADGTREWLDVLTEGHPNRVSVISLKENTGGAGGFSNGLHRAIESGADWTWMMDDDAEPHPEALAELMQIATTSQNIYGSLATSVNETSWGMTLLSDSPRTTYAVADIPTQARVQMLPFLGFLIHRDLVVKIGLPDPGFFIAADDAEYCVRAQEAGAQIIVAGRSRIEHPKSRPYEVKLPGCTVTVLELPPWKRYYDTRNRLLIARKYYGAKLLTHTIPGSLVRLIATLIKEPRKFEQLRAFIGGIIDGLLGRKGRRHEKWGIK